MIVHGLVTDFRLVSDLRTRLKLVSLTIEQRRWLGEVYQFNSVRSFDAYLIELILEADCIMVELLERNVAYLGGYCFSAIDSLSLERSQKLWRGLFLAMFDARLFLFLCAL